MLLQRVVEARSAVLDRIGDNLSKPSSDEQRELQNALETLSTLQELAERDISELKKTIQARLSGTVRPRRVKSSELIQECASQATAWPPCVYMRDFFVVTIPPGPSL